MGAPEGCGVYEMLEVPARGTENAEKGTETERRIAGQRERQRETKRRTERHRKRQRARRGERNKERERGKTGARQVTKHGSVERWRQAGREIKWGRNGSTAPDDSQK